MSGQKRCSRCHRASRKSLCWECGRRKTKVAMGEVAYARAITSMATLLARHPEGFTAEEGRVLGCLPAQGVRWRVHHYRTLLGVVLPSSRATGRYYFLPQDAKRIRELHEAMLSI